MIFRYMIVSMKDAAKLKVELEVDMHTGMTWYDAK